MSLYVHKPAGWPGGRLLRIIIISVLIYMLVSFLTMVVFHTHARCLYTASHVIGLSMIVCLLVIVHHCTEMHDAIGLSKSLFQKWQVSLNTLLLASSCCLAIVYSLLFAKGVHSNKDYLLAFLWAYLDTALFFYLLVVSADTSEDLSQLTEEEEATARSWKMVVRNAIVGVLFFSSQLFTLFLFVSAAYHSVASLHNLRQRVSEVVSLQVDGHNALAISFKCSGQGELIVVEQDIGGRSAISWRTLPQMLVDRGHRVCIYDRPATGDSEGYNTDFIGSSRDPLWSHANVPFLNGLLKSWNVSKPFYLLGYGYGGHHITFSTLANQLMVKGVIYLDSSIFTAHDDLHFVNVSLHDLDLLCRFQPSGIIRLIVESGILWFSHILGGMYDNRYMTLRSRQELYQDILADSTFCSIEREYLGYAKHSRKLLDYLSRQTTYIYSRVLVIDRDSREHWLPNHMFPYYNRSGHYIQIPGSDHFSLFYRQKYAKTVADKIQDFVRHGLFIP